MECPRVQDGGRKWRHCGHLVPSYNPRLEDEAPRVVSSDPEGSQRSLRGYSRRSRGIVRGSYRGSRRIATGSQRDDVSFSGRPDEGLGGWMSRPDNQRRGSVERRTARGTGSVGGPRSGPLPSHPRGGLGERGRGKKLRAAFQYVSRNEPTPEEAELWSKSGWTGCKLWGACGGKRCKDGDPDEKGRYRFRTPVKLPKSRPTGCHPVDRKISRCPLKECDPWIWSAIHQWSAWSRFKGLPEDGPLSQQDARLLDAIGIIDNESQLVSAHYSEVESERARRRIK